MTDFLNIDVPVADGQPTAYGGSLYPWMRVLAGGGQSEFSGIRMRGAIYDKNGNEILGGSGPVTAVGTQLTYKPGGVQNPPIYNDFNALMTEVASNQADNVQTTIIMDASLAPVVITQSYDMSNCQIVGNTEAIQNPTDVSFTGAGCFVNPHSLISIQLSITDYTAPRLRYTLPNQTFRFISTRFVPTFNTDESIIQVEANNIFWYLDIGSVLLNVPTNDHSYIKFVGGNHALTIICLYGGGFGNAIFNANGNTPIIQVFADSTASPLPSAISDSNITYLVDPVSNSQLVVYPDGNMGYELCAKPLTFPNRPTVYEAIDGCKRGFQRLYLRPNAPPNTNNFPYFSTITDVMTVVNNSQNLNKFYEVVLDDTYQNPIVFDGTEILDCQNRVSIIGKKPSSIEAQRVQVNISGPSGITNTINNCPRIDFVDFVCFQALTGGSCFAWSTGNTCIFYNCSFAVDISTGRPPIYPTGASYQLSFYNCEMNTPAAENTIGANFGGSVEIRFFDTIIHSSVIKPSANITVRYNSGCTFNLATFPLPTISLLYDDGNKVFYAASNAKVPTPTIPNNVTVSEMIAALDTLQADNTTSPSNVVVISGNGATLSVSNDPLSVANIGAQSVGFFGNTPISKPTSSGSAAYTPNASVNVVYAESRFGTGNWTITDIANALQSLGLLSS